MVKNDNPQNELPIINELDLIDVDEKGNVPIIVSVEFDLLQGEGGNNNAE